MKLARAVAQQELRACGLFSEPMHVTEHHMTTKVAKTTDGEHSPTREKKEVWI